jgi:hypothetical protein
MFRLISSHLQTIYNYVLNKKELWLAAIYWQICVSKGRDEPNEVNMFKPQHSVVRTELFSLNSWSNLYVRYRKMEC